MTQPTQMETLRFLRQQIAKLEEDNRKLSEELTECNRAWDNNNIDYYDQVCRELKEARKLDLVLYENTAKDRDYWKKACELLCMEFNDVEAAVQHNYEKAKQLLEITEK